jgi:glucose/arabinose dehydrogenase
MLLHPDFNNQSYVYLVYTYQSAGATKERLVKYFYNGSSLVNPQILIDNITANSTHDGSRLMLLPDSTFLMTTGDAQATSLPQNTNSLNGKILRFNLDGTIPSDNPNPNSYVYSWGHRNAQGLCMGPNNIIYCSEHGPTTDDELQIVQKAGNYGWPSVAGFCSTSSEISFCNDSSVIEPLVAWTPTIAPSDMVWYNHPSIPEFENKLLMTVLKNKRLIAFGFNPAGDSVIQESHYLVNQLRRLRDICVSPDGKIYLATNGDSWSNTNPFTHSIVELRNAAFVPSAVSVQSKPQIKIWPNPLSKGQQLNIVVDNNQNGTLRIFDLLGRSVYTKEFNNSFNFTLDLEQNLYLYHLELNDRTIHSGKLKIN